MAKKDSSLDGKYFDLTKSERRAIELRVLHAEQLQAEAAQNYRAAQQHVQNERQGALGEAIGFACDRIDGLEGSLEKLVPEWRFKGAQPVGFRLVPRPKAKASEAPLIDPPHAGEDETAPPSG